MALRERVLVLSGSGASIVLTLRGHRQVHLARQISSSKCFSVQQPTADEAPGHVKRDHWLNKATGSSKSVTPVIPWYPPTHTLVPMPVSEYSKLGRWSAQPICIYPLYLTTTTNHGRKNCLKEERHNSAGALQ